MAIHIPYSSFQYYMRTPTAALGNTDDDTLIARMYFGWRAVRIVIYKEAENLCIPVIKTFTHSPLDVLPESNTELLEDTVREYFRSRDNPLQFASIDVQRVLKKNSYFLEAREATHTGFS